MTRYDIINRFIADRNYQRYLEIGAKKGECLTKVNAPIRIAVDPDPRSVASYIMTSDAFFDMAKICPSMEHEFCPDIVFIDGLHEHNQVDRDIRNALGILSPDGVIILHDCLPTSEKMQEYHTESQDALWTGDVWKAFVKARAELPYELYTIDTDFGCGIIDTTIRKRSDTSALPTDMEQMTYEQFVNNPHWMNKKEDIIDVRTTRKQHARNRKS